MALTTYPITGDLKDALGGDSLIGEVTLTPYGSHDARLDGDNVLLGSISYALDKSEAEGGLPASLSLTAGAWIITIRAKGRVQGEHQFKTIQHVIDHQAATTWGAIVSGAVSSPPMTPTLVQQAQDAATAAEADAAAASTSATNAAASEAAAEAAAATATAPTDSMVASLAADPASLTGAELRETFVASKVVPVGLGNGTTDATAGIQSVIDAANTEGVGVVVPAGNYMVTAPLENVRRLHLADGARIFAGTAGMAAVVRTQETTRWDNGWITGKGTIDAGTNATIGLHLRNFLYFEVNGIQITGGTIGLRLGASTAAGRSAEAVVSNVRIIGGTVTAGSRGIEVENSGDHSISQVLIQNYETGVYLPAAGNAMLHDVHVWTEPAKGATKVGFQDHSNNSHYVQCHADTPTEYGWRLYGYQTTLVQCGTYINPTAGSATDNIVVGIKFEGTNSIATVVGHFFLGGSATKRLKADIEAADGKYGLITVVPVTGQHTVTTRAFRARVVGLDSRDAITSEQEVGVNPATPLADAGLAIKTNGLTRWRLASDGVAESGANAGSGLLLRRYDDAGAFLGNVFYVARTGTMVMYSNVLFGPSSSLIPDGTSGLKVGTAATQKLGFWGATPVVQPQTSGVTAGHVAGTGAAVTADSTFTGNWGATPYTISDIISNLKQAGILKS